MVVWTLLDWGEGACIEAEETAADLVSADSFSAVDFISEEEDAADESIAADGSGVVGGEDTFIRTNVTSTGGGTGDDDDRCGISTSQIRDRFGVCGS